MKIFQRSLKCMEKLFVWEIQIFLKCLTLQIHLNRFMLHLTENAANPAKGGLDSTYHISQEPSVLWIILGDINKSRKSPSLSFCSSLHKYSSSSGISLPFSLATLLRISLASITRPFFNNQRTDSGMKLWSNPTQTSRDQYQQTPRRNLGTSDLI